MNEVRLRNRPGPRLATPCARVVDDSVDIHYSEYRESARPTVEAKAEGEQESERTRGA